jgi:hypothetical protein
MSHAALFADVMDLSHPISTVSSLRAEGSKDYELEYEIARISKREKRLNKTFGQLINEVYLSTSPHRSSEPIASSAVEFTQIDLHNPSPALIPSSQPDDSMQSQRVMQLVHVRCPEERCEARKLIAKELMAKRTPELVSIGKHYFQNLPAVEQRKFRSHTKKVRSYLNVLSHRFVSDCRKRQISKDANKLQDDHYLLIAKLSATADCAAGDWVRDKTFTTLRLERTAAVAPNVDIGVVDGPSASSEHASIGSDIQVSKPKSTTPVAPISEPNSVVARSTPTPKPSPITHNNPVTQYNGVMPQHSVPVSKAPVPQYNVVMPQHNVPISNTPVPQYTVVMQHNVPVPQHQVGFPQHNVGQVMGMPTAYPATWFSWVDANNQTHWAYPMWWAPGYQ